MSLQDLEALSKMVPTKEEEAKLANYKGDILELGSAEKLVKAMLQIPFAFSRIEAMLYRETFEDEVLHLKKSFSILEVITSPSQLLNPKIMSYDHEIVLLLGGMQGTPIKPAIPQTARGSAQDREQDERGHDKRRSKSFQAGCPTQAC